MFTIEAIKYGRKDVLTTRQLAELFDVDTKVINKNFQRNASRYEEGKHYFLLSGDTLRRYKKLSKQEEVLKFVSILYFWTKEGAFLLAKSCSSNSTWEAFDSLLEEIYKNE